MANGLPALWEEIEKNGTEEEEYCSDYVAKQEAGSDAPHVTFQNGWRRD